MVKVGQLCIKIAGREAGKECAVVKVLKNNYVIIDGNVRRKKCNLSHLEPVNRLLKIKSKATTAEVKEAMKKEGIVIPEKKEKKPKEKKVAAKPKKK